MHSFTHSHLNLLERRISFFSLSQPAVLIVRESATFVVSTCSSSHSTTRGGGKAVCHRSSIQKCFSATLLTKKNPKSHFPEYTQSMFLNFISLLRKYGNPAQPPSLLVPQKRQIRESTTCLVPPPLFFLPFFHSLLPPPTFTPVNQFPHPPPPTTLPNPTQSTISAPHPLNPPTLGSFSYIHTISHLISQLIPLTSPSQPSCQNSAWISWNP